MRARRTTVGTALLGCLLVTGAFTPAAQATPARRAPTAGPPLTRLSTLAGKISGPTPVPAPPIDLAAGEVCTFAVHIAFPVDDEVTYIQTDASGNTVAQYFTGALIGRVRRVDTGRSLTVDLSGSGVQIPGPAGTSTLYGVGPYLLIGRVGDSPSHELAQPSGLSALRFGADGHKTLLYATHVTNLCARLAS